MLTTLPTIKSRLSIPDIDPQFDALLTNAIQSVSARFDRECNRTFARTENATYEFDPVDTEILVPCYPVESVTKFELKSSEFSGWTELPNVNYLLRHQCIISLAVPLSAVQNVSISAFQHFSFSLSRVTYTGGYVLPGDPDPDYQPSTLNYPPVRLPADVEAAAVEQVAAWFYNRTHLGLKTLWVHEGDYRQFRALDLLPEVRAVLKTYARISL